MPVRRSSPARSRAPRAPGPAPSERSPLISARELLELAEHPLRGVGRQVGQVLEELLHVLARDAGAEVVAQEAMEVRRDALGEKAAAAQRRDDEALHRPQPPPAWQVAHDLVALRMERGEHRGGIDADLLPDAEE